MIRRSTPRQLPEEIPNKAPKALSVKANMLWYSAGAFTQTFSSWLLTVVAVRFSEGFDAAGVLALAISILNFFNPIAEFKLRMHYVTDIEKTRLAGQYIGTRIFTTFFTFLAAALYASSMLDFSVFLVVSIYVASQLIRTFAEGYHAVQQRAMKMDYIGISYMLNGLLSLIAFTLMLYFTNSLPCAVSTLLIISLVVTFALDLPLAQKIEPVVPIFDWKGTLKLLTPISSLVAVGLALNIVGLAPRQYLLSLSGSEALGIYSAVAMPAVIIQVAAGYLYAPLLGQVATLFHSHKRRALTIQLRTIAATLGITLLISCIFWFADDDLLALIFGDSIRPYTYLIQPALFLSFITAITWYTNDLLFTLRDFKGCFIGGITAGIVTLATTVPLTKLCGLNGPSAVGICAYVCALIVMMCFYVRDYRAIPQNSTNAV